MLLKLPIEILEHVLYYCEIKDKRAIACCSKRHCSLMEPLLWRTVYMRPALLATTWPNDVFNKFRHAKTLNFYPSITGLLIPSESEYHKTQPSASALVNFGYNLAMVLAAIDPHQLTELSVSYVVSDESFNYIMERLCFVEHLDLVDVKLTDERNWANVPTSLTHLHMGGTFHYTFCDATDESLKAILERNQLKRLECALDFQRRVSGRVSGLSNESVRHISKAISITELKLFLYLPPPLDLTCLGDMTNLTSLHLRGRIPVLDDRKFMFHICQNLQQLQVLALSGLELTDESFSKIHLLGSLTKLSLQCMDSLSACSVFHYIKSHGSLCDLDFDGESFRELSLEEDLADERKQQIYSDIRILNQLPKLSIITVNCGFGFDISQSIVEGLCQRKKWIHHSHGCVHTFFKDC